MSAIAELLLNLGYEVSGSDMQRTDIMDRLESLGARIVEGHDARNLGDAEVLVYSSAVKPSNVEVAAARQRGLPALGRAEVLAELMQVRQGIAIAGAHGKTTTTSMIAIVLDAAGLDPTAVIGGRVSMFGGNARLGQGKYFVAEADESDRSFLLLKPQIAVITNIDREHLEAYRDFEELQQAFVTFANSVPDTGVVVLCGDDPFLAALRGAITRRVVTYGLSTSTDVTATDVRLEGFGSTSTVKDSGTLTLRVPGRHNVLNALAAVAVARELEIDWTETAKGLASFHGAERRFQRRGEANGVTVVEDYGHHPTEIAAVVAAARPIATGRLLVAFQPHRYSRTKMLLDAFGPSFSGVDALILTDIYAASEEPIAGADVETLATAIRRDFRGDLEIVKELRNVPRALAQRARPGDLILLLGAGSIGASWRDVLSEIERKAAH